MLFEARPLPVTVLSVAEEVVRIVSRPFASVRVTTTVRNEVIVERSLVELSSTGRSDTGSMGSVVDSSSTMREVESRVSSSTATEAEDRVRDREVVVVLGARVVVVVVVDDGRGAAVVAAIEQVVETAPGTVRNAVETISDNEKVVRTAP